MKVASGLSTSEAGKVRRAETVGALIPVIAKKLEAFLTQDFVGDGAAEAAAEDRRVGEHPFGERIECVDLCCQCPLQRLRHGIE